MKLENLVFDFDKFASEMANLKEKKHFDYLVTIVGEDFGDEEGLGCIYILENTDTRERTSVKMLAKQVGEEDFVIPTVSNIWKVADLLEREVFDFYGIKFLVIPTCAVSICATTSRATPSANTGSLTTPTRSKTMWSLITPYYIN